MLIFIRNINSCAKLFYIYYIRPSFAGRWDSNAFCSVRIAGDMAVRYVRGHAPVIEVYDSTAVTHIPIFQEQICEIYVPFLVRLVRMEVLL